MSQGIPKILKPNDSMDIDDLNRFVLLKYGELDSDLYDRVSYLDLVNQCREKNKAHNTEQLGPINRNRKDVNKSPDCSTSKTIKKNLVIGETKSDLANTSFSSNGCDNLTTNNYKVPPSLSLPSHITESSDLIAPSSIDASVADELYATENPIASTQKMDTNIRHIWSEAIDMNEIRNIEDQADFRSLRAQLGIDKISSETMSRYYVKAHMNGYDQPAICYPRHRGPATQTRIPCGLKLIRRVGDKLKKENYPEVDEFDKTKFSGIFGYHTITQSDNRVVLTTNERDALAVYDSTNGIPALTLPNGEHLDQSVLPYLEDFDLIYLWFPLIHEHHAKEYASHLNASRCYIITKMERPVELIRDNRNNEILHSIQEAVRVRHRGFRSLNDIRDEVKSEIVESKSRLTGIAQWKRYDILNHYMGGFRSGELTILTGGTGYGKTTFLCEYAVDLYTQEVRTLFCSFEVSEEKILKWMLVQFSGPPHVRNLARSRTNHNGMKIPLHRVDHHASVELWLDRFERTHADFIIMKVDEFRNKTIKEISDAIKEQIIAGGVQHVVIDNLQLLVSLATLNNDLISAQEKSNIQDRFVGFLRRIANDYGPHITLVVHPRRANEELDLQNIGGSNRIVQEADNVLVIQRRRDELDRRRFRKFLYILKNRFGGKQVESDQIEMIFQPLTYTHTLVKTSTQK